MRKGKIIVASMMVLYSLVFVVAAWFMLFQGKMADSTLEEKQVAILHAAGLIKSEIQDKKSVETLYHRYIIQRHVNLDSGELVADTVRQKCEKLAAERDPAKVRQRCTVADVFFVKDKNNQIQQVIIPVTGKGAKSMMYAFLALGLDGRTVKNLYYYQQRETPFLGARVEDASWRKQWPGKRLLDNSGHPALKIVQDKPEHTDEYTVDGISGATLTSTGVEKSINYWMGPQGYGQFLQRLASDRNNLNL
ncbi:Na(+)-translocating NADH-quinone reductase subunit C [Salmonella enterica subsp. enterica]|nr:Na(+)-translocating NADH-quinone reductase subunit C [Salmonella enterica]EDT2972300.1 Na(+)-translocating NADH-quinone reductase subunit C [Salmonella enterica subsp. enterica serovar Fischerstrasse]